MAISLALFGIDITDIYTHGYRYPRIEGEKREPRGADVAVRLFHMLSLGKVAFLSLTQFTCGY